ncbi:MAG: phage tail protein [Akkermansiaceae bacterium]
MSEPFLGQILTFAGNYTPSGYASCDGQLLPINTNQALFSILGTIYGGDGRTTFGLPNLNGRTPIHPGTGAGLSTFSLGQETGTEEHTLTQNHIPQHTHAIGEVKLPTSDTAATLKSPTDNYPAQPPTFAYGDATDAKAAIISPAATNSTGSAIPIDNRKPTLTLKYAIAVTGLFPSRN